MNRQTWINCLIITLIAGFIMVYKLGDLPLLDPDEPVYAQTAMEMLANHDFLSPRIYGDFWYDKPPMYYWLVAAAIKLLGAGELAARVPSAVFAVGGALLVYLAGRSLINNRAGLLAALVLATSLEYFYLGKAAVTDATLSFFMSACLLFYLQKKYYLAYGAAGLAVLTKGPVGIVLPAIIVFLHMLATRSWREIRNWKIIRGSLLFLAIALPWYLGMYYVHGMDFVDTFLGFHNVTRFLEPEHPSGKLWYYYIPVLLLGFFPWTIFLVQSVVAAVKDRSSREGSNLLFLVIWAAAVLLFFTLSQTKLVSYILPMYPPLALLVGWYLDKCLGAAMPGVFRNPAILLTTCVVVMEAGLLLAARSLLPGLWQGAVNVGMILLLVLAAAWYMVIKERSLDFVRVLVGGMMAFVVVIMTQLLPVAAQSFSVKELAGEFREHYDGQAPVYVAKNYRPGFTYYAGIAGQELTSNQQVLDIVHSGPGKAYVVVKKQAYLSLPPAEQSHFLLVATQKDVALLLKESNN